MDFDIEGARKAGYSDKDIADHLGKQSNFDVEGARKSGYTDDQLVAHLATPANMPEMPQPQGFGAQLEAGIKQIPRQLGLTARYGIEGAAAAGGMLVDPILTLMNQKTTAQRGTNIADAVGLPKPQGSFERVVGDASRMVAGTGLTAGAAGALSGGTQAGSVARGVVESMAARPGLQAVSAASAGAAGGATRETGGGPLAQTVAAVGGGLLGGGLAAGATAAKGAVDRWAKNRTLTPADIDIRIEQSVNPVLNQSGMTYGDISADVRSAIRKDVQKAMLTGQQLDDAAVARLVDYRMTGAKPTLGSLTLDPAQITRERNLAKVSANSSDPLTQGLAQQQNANMRLLAGNMDDVGASNAPDSMRTGQSLLDMITGKDARMKAVENNLYSKARGTDGRALDLDREGFINQAYQRLAESNKGAFLPEGVGKLLEQIRTGKASQGGREFDVPFNVDVIDNLKTTLASASRSSQDGNTKAAIAAVRDALEATQPTATGRPVGGNQVVDSGLLAGAQTQADETAGAALKAFDDARSFARGRRNWQESAPSIADALNGVPPDKFVENYILGTSNKASAREVEKLAAELNEAGLMPMVKQHIAAWMKSKATGDLIGESANDTTRFSAEGLKSALKQIGDDKLRIFFDPEEIAKIKAVRRVAKYETVQPTGSAVNNSNTAASAMVPLLEMAGRSKLLSRIPVVGDGVRDAASNWVNQINIKQAQNIPQGLLSPVMTPGASNPLLSPASVLMLPGIQQQ